MPCPEGSQTNPQDERLLLNDETQDSWPPEEMNSIRARDEAGSLRAFV